MSATAASRLDALLAQAAREFDGGKVWVVAGFAPVSPACHGKGQLDPEATRTSLLQVVRDWPAPLGVGQGRCDPLPDGALVFASLPESGPQLGHLCILVPDGGCVMAVQVGALRDAADRGIWTVGEGALAWLTVCFVQLAASWFRGSGAATDALAELGIAGAAPGGVFQIGNFVGGINAPVGVAVSAVRPERAGFSFEDLEANRTALLARNLLLPLLRQFALRDLRHIDADGVLQPEQFVGHADAIRSWANATGLVAA